MFRVLILSVLMLLFVGQAYSKTLPVEPPKQPVQEPVQLTHKHTADCQKTKAEPVQIICILDRSGSMSNLAADTIGGYNSFIEQQKTKAGTAEVTTVLFDDQYEKISDATDINAVPELTSEQYYARGTTALLDAVGRTITETLSRLESKKICPAKRRVLVTIMTDGYENASKEFTKAKVKALVEATTKEYDWNYIFIGANIDAAAEAGGIGIDSRHAANYKPTSEGVQESFAIMRKATDEVREHGTLSR
ncbi:MAG: VWA domain-containing protein [Selenomonadaceae bacterium]|nr:VWA domain-containing protein [Selenomonadaceae bacterium]